MVDLTKCADCGADNPEMYNCNKHGEPLNGFICFKCWKAKHPAFVKPKPKVNPALMIWVLFMPPIIGFMLYHLYNIGCLL